MHKSAMGVNDGTWHFTLSSSNPRTPRFPHVTFSFSLFVILRCLLALYSPFLRFSFLSSCIARFHAPQSDVYLGGPDFCTNGHSR